METVLENIYPSARALKDGHTAGYIPELAEVNPDLFAISVCAADGRFWSIGDNHIAFTLQSCVKPMLYSVALGQIGQKVSFSFGRDVCVGVCVCVCVRPEEV